MIYAKLSCLEALYHNIRYFKRSQPLAAIFLSLQDAVENYFLSQATYAYVPCIYTSQRESDLVDINT